MLFAIIFLNFTYFKSQLNIIKIKFFKKKLNDSHPHLGTNGVFLMFLHPFFCAVITMCLSFHLKYESIWLCDWTALQCLSLSPAPMYLGCAPLLNSLAIGKCSLITDSATMSVFLHFFLFFIYFLGIASQAPHYWIQNC